MSEWLDDNGLTEARPSRGGFWEWCAALIILFLIFGAVNQYQKKEAQKAQEIEVKRVQEAAEIRLRRENQPDYQEVLRQIRQEYPPGRFIPDGEIERRLQILRLTR